MLNKLKCTAILSILSVAAFAQQPILIDVDVKLNADTFFVKLQVPYKGFQVDYRKGQTSQTALPLPS